MTYFLTIHSLSDELEQVMVLFVLNSRDEFLHFREKNSLSQKQNYPHIKIFQ